jgi:hypothetical protein
MYFWDSSSSNIFEAYLKKQPHKTNTFLFLALSRQRQKERDMPEFFGLAYAMTSGGGNNVSPSKL